MRRIIVNGVVYAVSFDGKIYAFGLKRGAQEEDAASKPPDRKTLRPDLNLKVSTPDTATASAKF
jgi:hypothetical protein